MMFLSCILMCCTQVLSYNSKWSKQDQEHLTIARSRCKEIYPNSPCLTKFQKTEELVYRAICGKNNNE